MYIDSGGRFSILGLCWQPGQSTRIHDHISCGAVGVIAGVESEIVFDAGLDPLGHTDFHDGEVTWVTPPGDIRQVHNLATTTAVSIRVYGADLRQAGSSVRRCYDRRQPDDEAERPQR